MRTPDLVSVVTATYNMANYLSETLDSVLAQDYEPIESIVIDDGSTDETSAVLARYATDPRVRVIKQENSGQTVAKNRGIAESRGEFVAFCDADDTWRPDKLSLQIPRFRSDDDVAVVFSEKRCIDSDGKPRPLIGPTDLYRGRVTAQLLIDNFVPFPSAVVRGRVLDELGGFDERLSMSIDYELWLRISAQYRFDYVPQKLVNYRVWDGQMSHRTGERLENFFALLTRFLAGHPGLVTPAEERRAWGHVHVTRGYWHARCGRRGDAWRDYRQALGLNPMDERLWKRMISLAVNRDREQ
jgi:glycosyltransferase involved in cell wall biosynthesis